jgi:hypothetical protein
MHNRSSYVYYPPAKGLTKTYLKPTDERITQLKEELATYFLSEAELGKGTSLLTYDFEKETWFLVRYPGQLERHEAIDADGNDACESDHDK